MQHWEMYNHNFKNLYSKLTWAFIFDSHTCKYHWKLNFKNTKINLSFKTMSGYFKKYMENRIKGRFIFVQKIWKPLIF